MVSAMRALKRAGLVLGVLLLAGGAYALWYVYGAWPVPEGYEFPRHSLWGSGPDALFEGELVWQGGCIRTSEGEGGSTVVWPPGYSLRLTNGQVEVHGSGRVVRMGERVRMGGGWYETNDGFDVLPETRCPAPYMLSTGFVD